MWRIVVVIAIGGCASAAVKLADAHDVVERTDRGSHYTERDLEIELTIEHVGDGCYVVNGERLYECTTDDAPAGQVSCVEDLRTCGGECRQMIVTTPFVGLWPGVPIETEPSRRCRDKFQQGQPKNGTVSPAT